MELVDLGRIRQAMAKRGWNQARFSRELGVQESQVSRILSGEVVPTLSTLKRWGQVLGASPRLWVFPK